MNTDDLYRKRTTIPILTRDDLYRKQPTVPAPTPEDLYRKEPAQPEAARQEDKCTKMAECLDRLNWKTENLARKMVAFQCDLAEMGRDFMAAWESAGEDGRESSVVPKTVIAAQKDHIHISTNFCPPKFSVYPSWVRTRRTNYQDVRNIWYSAMFDALQKAPPIPKTDKAFVLLVYRRKARSFDPPNLDTKIILDALIDFGLLLDDSEDNIMLMVTGKNSEEEGTDIYICSWEKMCFLLPVLLEEKLSQGGPKGCLTLCTPLPE